MTWRASSGRPYTVAYAAAVAAAAEYDGPVPFFTAGDVESKYSTDNESPPVPPRVRVRFHPKSKSSSDLGRVLIVNDSPA
jgi:hypothetical protein